MKDKSKIEKSKEIREDKYKNVYLDRLSITN